MYMYDFLKGDYSKPNGTTENRLQKAYNNKNSPHAFWHTGCFFIRCQILIFYLSIFGE